jgi:hypothetical protein
LRPTIAIVTPPVSVSGSLILNSLSSNDILCLV